MIKKRVAKTSNQRNSRQQSDHELVSSSSSGTTNDIENKQLHSTTTTEHDQQTIHELLNEKQSSSSIIPPPLLHSKKSSTIDFIGLYDGESSIIDNVSTITPPLQDAKFSYDNSDETTVKYQQPKERRIIKQSTTFSTSDLKKRKRHETHSTTTSTHDETIIISVPDTHSEEQNEGKTPITTDAAEIVPLTTTMVDNIPDDITIQAIKMKRKKIREGIHDTVKDSTVDDFIPLEYMPDKPGLGFSGNMCDSKHELVIRNGGGIILHKNQQDSNNSRLVREDDEIEDNIDEIINREEEVFESWKQSKIMFGNPNDDRNNGDQRESFGEIDMDDTINEPVEDEDKNREISDFEMKQMRNAGLCIPENTIYTQNNLFKSSEELEKEVMLKIEEDRILEESINRFDLKNDSKLIESFESVEKQLLQRMKELEISHSSCLKVVLDTNNDIEHSAKILSQLNEDVDQYKEQYEYFQEMGRFIDNLSDLLDTKLPDIDVIESQIVDIQERYYRQLFEKSFHGHVSFMPAYREDQHERAASFGGDGTVEMTNDRFVQEVSILVEKMKIVFSDVDEEYCRLSLLKARFEGWKCKYPSLYKDTYCSMCLQKMFSIFLRFELFTTGSLIDFYGKGNSPAAAITYLLPSWSISPLLCTSFSDFEFWKLLFNYGENTNQNEEETILPEIIRKTILPFVLHTLSKIYNPMDTNQTKSAIELVKEYKIYLDSKTNNEDLKIMEIIVDRLCETIHNFKFPSIVQDTALVDEYVNQCIGIISESVLPWLEIYPPLNSSDKLAYQVINQLINTKLVTFVDCCVSKSLISKMEKIKYLMRVNQFKLPIHWRRELQFTNY